ncbi:hypothetical protein HYH03_001553 [Edaphochlamys debaryana]|uniref:Uncharacterized protein n=1 Tax=Edaphochlamys debaryana TaxID=47281 RepID=A0A835YDW2_9CHLO|nr:hypothetical protein HYH03_001553 [Edaphochlamys debaryana]|eukprot:KAG2500791.1 hypothetical protein HYH03_001553 [Edaphochlamys debaryana]
MDSTGLSSPGQLFVEDAHNLVVDYVAEGIEAFHSCVRPALASREDASGEAGSSGSGDVLSSLDAGTQRLYESMVSRVGSSLRLFEQVCAASVFQPSLRVSIPQVPPARHGSTALALSPIAVTPGASPLRLGGGEGESEAELVARIERMRRELSEVDQRCAALRSDIARVDQRLAAAGDTSDYTALASSAAASKAAILAVATAAAGLQNMMEKAARLRAQQGGQAGAGAGKPEAGVANAAVTSLASVRALADLVRA